VSTSWNPFSISCRAPLTLFVTRVMYCCSSWLSSRWVYRSVVFECLCPSRYCVSFRSVL